MSKPYKPKSELTKPMQIASTVLGIIFVTCLSSVIIAGTIKIIGSWF